MYAESLRRSELRSELRGEFRNDWRCELRGEVWRGKMQSGSRRPVPSKSPSERTSWAQPSTAIFPCSVSETSNVSDASSPCHSFPREFFPPSRFRVTPTEDHILPKPRAHTLTASNHSTEESCSSSDDGSLPPDSFSGQSWLCPLSAATSTASDPLCASESRHSSNEPLKSGFAMYSASFEQTRACSDFADTRYGMREMRNPGVEFSHGTQSNVATSSVAVAGRQLPSFESIGFGEVTPSRNLTCIGLGTTPEDERKCPTEAEAGPANSCAAMESSNLVRLRARSDFTSTGYGTRASDVRIGINVPCGPVPTVAGPPPSFESTQFGHDAPPQRFSCAGFRTTTERERNCHFKYGAAPDSAFSWGHPQASREFQQIRGSRSLHRPVAKHVPQQSGLFRQSRRKQGSLPSVAARAGAMPLGSSGSRERMCSNLTQSDKPRFLHGLSRFGRKDRQNSAVSRVFRKIRRAGAGDE